MKGCVVWAALVCGGCPGYDPGPKPPGVSSELSKTAAGTDGDFHYVVAQDDRYSGYSRCYGRLGECVARTDKDRYKYRRTECGRQSGAFRMPATLADGQKDEACYFTMSIG
jgi:hypothetical protein